MATKRADTLKARSGQSRRFIETARELGCDEDPEAFERVFARVVPPRKRPKAPEPENRHAKRTATKRRLNKASEDQS